MLAWKLRPQCLPVLHQPWHVVAMSSELVGVHGDCVRMHKRPDASLARTYSR
jgi:hypothetical protein